MRVLLLLLLFFFPTLSLSFSAFRLRIFRACIPRFVSLHLRNTSAYFALKSQSFVNVAYSPLAIVRVSSEPQVQIAVRCARKARLRICPRSGGHSLIGASLCNGVVLDLQDLRKVKPQPGGVVEVGAGANLGEVLWGVWQNGNRWLAAGVCPSVGMGGYVFGGGHGPYEGRLGMACDSLVSVRIVDRFGKLLVAARGKRPALFWALCGAGGGQFGVVTSFRMRTVSSKPFDKAVVFRFRWPHKEIGQLMHKWMDYGEMGGNVWFRMEMYLANAEQGMSGYGACYNVASKQECMNRLNKAPFFRTPGRVTLHLSKVNNALDVHSYFGPEGRWGRRRAGDVRKALLQQRGTASGGANDNVYQSTFLKKRRKGGKRITPQFWQKYADFCANPGRGSIPWIVCELNLFNNAINRKRNNAFAHREADIITHYIVGGGSKEDKRFVYYWMKRHLRPYTVGVYVNYPERQLKSYAKAYWGKSLTRLKRVKRMYDPKLFFMNPQPIPRK